MYRILVGDIDPFRAQYIKRILAHRNVCNLDSITLMSDGLQIRQAMLSNCYDLVILNENLGGMKGMSCIEYLVKNNTRHQILIIFTNPSAILTREAFLLGVQGIYEIPILIDSFVAIVSNLLDHKKNDYSAKIYDIYTRHKYSGLL